MKLVTVVNYNLFGCAMRIYVFPYGLVSYRYHKKLIKYEKRRKNTELGKNGAWSGGNACS